MSGNPSVAESGGSDALRQQLAKAAPGLLCAYGLGLVVVGMVRVQSAALASALTIASWLAFTALILLVAASLAAVRASRQATALIVILGTVGWAILAYLVPAPEPSGALLAHAHQAVRTICMMTAAAALGSLISGLFREPSLLPPALVLAGVVDIIGVKFGVVAKVASSNIETITKASAAVPAVASLEAARIPLEALTIGPGDIVFAALIFGVVVRAGWDLRSNLIWMFGLTAAGLGIVVAANLLVPGLVFIGLAGIVANRTRFAYTKDEQRALLIATALVLSLLSMVSLALYGRP